MSRKTRRAFLATAGAIGFAGCSQSFGFPGGSDSSRADDESTTVNGTTTTATSTNATDATDGSTTTDATTGTSGSRIGTQVDGFENFDRWFVIQDQGKLTADAEDAYEGSQSARVASDPGDSFGGVYKAFTEPKDFSGKNFSMAVKLKKPRIAKVSLALLAPDRGNMVRMMRTLTGPTDRWLRIDFGATTVKRDPDLSKVQEIRIVCRRRDGKDEPVDFKFDDLRAVDAPKKGAVMLTFDDSHVSHYERAFPAMQEYGFPGVEGVIAESVYGSNRLDVGMMRKMRDAGWDMASHPLTRGTWLPEFSQEEQEKRIVKNKRFLVRKGFPDGARHFLTPQNMRGPHTLDLVRKHHETMYSFGGMPNGLPPTTNYNYGRINGWGDVSGVKRLVDYAARFKQLVVINHHAIGPDGFPEEDFSEQLKYIDAADVDVVTASDVLDRRKQLTGQG